MEFWEFIQFLIGLITLCVLAGASLRLGWHFADFLLGKKGSNQ